MKISSLIKGYIVCGITYALAGIISLILFSILSFFEPLILILIVDILATILIFVLGSIFHNASLYDPYWSVAPFAIALYWLISSPIEVILQLKQVIIFGLIMIWSFRLTYNWIRQWKGIQHEDWRYKELRIKHGNKFWFISLTGIHLMPTILVYLGALSFYPSIVLNPPSFDLMDIFAIIVTSSAILLETIADQQSYNFIQSRKNNAELIDYGLWKYSRHPNYLGEILFWWGIYLFALSIDISYYWMIIGPISITILFNVVSIPLMEERNLKTKPDYEEYRNCVSRLILWFRKDKKE